MPATSTSCPGRAAPPDGGVGRGAGPGSLRAQFPDARVIITEIDDEELGVSYSGPVSRLLDAGATAYLPPRPVSAIASMVRDVLTGDDAPQRLTSAGPSDRGSRVIGPAGRVIGQD